MKIEAKQPTVKGPAETFTGDVWVDVIVPERDYPRYCKLLMSGKLDLEPLLSRSYALADVNAALTDLEHGKKYQLRLTCATPEGHVGTLQTQYIFSDPDRPVPKTRAEKPTPK